MAEAQTDKSASTAADPQSGLALLDKLEAERRIGELADLEITRQCCLPDFREFCQQGWAAPDNTSGPNSKPGPTYDWMVAIALRRC